MINLHIKVSLYGNYLDTLDHEGDGGDYTYSSFKFVRYGQAKLSRLDVVIEPGKIISAIELSKGRRLIQKGRSPAIRVRANR